ncbi:MAG TPA: hypothetical protein VKX40_04895, partial [Aequorivita sp.]|nr:hypothetical protein [Aequorivita sp.]
QKPLLLEKCFFIKKPPRDSGVKVLIPFTGKEGKPKAIPTKLKIKVFLHNKNTPRASEIIILIPFTGKGGKPQAILSPT